MGVVAAGAYDFKDVHAGIDLDSVFPHGGSAACNFVGGLGAGALGGKRGQERGVLGGGGLAAHDLVHHSVGFVVGQVLFIHDLDNSFFDHRSNLLYKIPQHRFAVGCHDGFRMELHAVDGVNFVLHRHDLALLGTGGHGQFRGQGVGIHGQ